MDVGVLCTNPDNPALPTIMSKDGIDTLSIAVTGEQLVGPNGDEVNLERLDKALDVAKGAGKKTTPRVRMGAGTPDRYLERRNMIPTSGPAQDKTVPVPVLERGAPNVSWLEGWQHIQDDVLAPWVRENMVVADGPVHLSHFGGNSAELFVSDQMLDLEGVDIDTVNDACVALVRLCAGMDVANPVELSYSGLEQDCEGFRDAQAVIHEEMVAQNGTGREFWTQRNGYTGLSNAAPPPLGMAGRYGLQMVKPFQPNGDPFPWRQTIPRAAQVARYLEVYDTSIGSWKGGKFVLAKGGAELLAEAAKV